MIPQGVSCWSFLLHSLLDCTLSQISVELCALSWLPRKPWVGNRTLGLQSAKAYIGEGRVYGASTLRESLFISISFLLCSWQWDDHYYSTFTQESWMLEMRKKETWVTQHVRGRACCIPQMLVCTSLPHPNRRFYL